jgi:arginyl-tRNA synthetase
MSASTDTKPTLQCNLLHPAVLSWGTDALTTVKDTPSPADWLSSLSTLKAIWVSQVASIPLHASFSSTSGKSHVALQLSFSNHAIEGHVNSNVLACTLASVSTALSFTDATISCSIDDYCEWEQSTLQSELYQLLQAKLTVSATVATRLQTLLALVERALTTPGSSPCHLVKHSLSLVDICICTTLWQFTHLYAGSLPETTSVEHVLAELFTPTIQRFLRTHATGFEVAYAAAKDGLPSSSTAAVSSSMDVLQEPSMMRAVDAVFRSVIHGIFSTDIPLPKTIVKPCANPKHGDFQFSAAMPIYATLSKDKSSPSSFNGPLDVANAILQALTTEEPHPILSDLTIQGPGFILCRVSATYLQYHLQQYLSTQTLCMPTHVQPQVCVVDFSSPNIAKEMHVGHLRSTIIGESVCRILEAFGHSVHRINHVGDWGTQFGMLIQYLKEEYPAVATMTMEENGEGTKTNTGDLPNITDLTVFYKNAKQRFDESAEFKKTSQLNVVQLQSGDSECRRIWQLLCDISRREFQKVYTRLDVSCVEFGESFYNARIPGVIEEFEKAQKIQIEEGGAKCVFVTSYKVPLMLQKSDGGFGYDSTDMAALKYRLQELKAQRIIYITDFTQGDHFKMVFEAGAEIGWLQEGQQLQHIGFGTVQGEDGKRFKTRSGDTVRLVELLDEAVLRMENELRSRITEGKANITEEEVHEVAEAIGYGAVKYFDLRRNPTTNYKFSYDLMLDTKGDTAVYLLYARVRLESIVAKAAAEHNVVVEELLQNGATIVLTHPSERNLALQLLSFTDMMEQTLDDLYPYHICEYVYKLATAASDFVTQCRVLGSPEMPSRILLCHATTNAMRQCFDLLGIRHVKRI